MTIDFVKPVEITKKMVEDALLVSEGMLYRAAEIIRFKTSNKISTNKLKEYIIHFDLESVLYDLECDMEKKIEETLIEKIFDSECKQSVAAAVTILKKKYGWKDGAKDNKSKDDEKASNETVSKLSEEDLNILHSITKKAVNAA